LWQLGHRHLALQERPTTNSKPQALQRKCRSLRICRPCRGRWLSSNRNFSRNVVLRGGEKTQSGEPTPCRGRIFPAGGDDRRVWGWSWCSPPLRWTRKRPGSLPGLARIRCALGRRGQRLSKPRRFEAAQTPGELAAFISLGLKSRATRRSVLDGTVAALAARVMT